MQTLIAMFRTRRMLRAISLIMVSSVVFTIAFAGYLVILHHQPLILPAPTGPYGVGRTEYDWIDENRIDPFSDRANERRELLAWVWYPTAGSVQGPRAPFLPSIWVNLHERDQSIGRFIESDFSAIQTHSFKDTPPAESQSAYPVIIMLPGMGPVATDYTVFAENLASHGYVVLGINPTYTSNVIVFPDGRVALRTDKGTIPDDADTMETDLIASRIGKVWAEDALFVMDRLQSIDADQASLLYNKLDLTNIGLFGHSFGGATAASVCKIDVRCKAGADLDGTLFSYQASGTLQTPFMFMAEDACGKDCETMRQAFSASKDAAYYLSIKGARHFNFSDLPLRWLRPGRILFKITGYIGSIRPERGLEVTNAYLTAFFDKYLKDDDSGLLQGSSPAFPEVHFGKR